MPAKRRSKKVDISDSEEEPVKNLKKINNKDARSRNQALLKGKFDEQVEELTKFLYEKLKNKDTKVIDRHALMKAVTSLGLWNDIFEEDIDNMLELFSPNGVLNYDTMKEVFMKCKINVKGFIE